ncbi:tyrosine-type recombinase/integrase [Streptomyces calidiresistens]|uniref:tyrosine-type recombinase/integrase n=1 Tax=Streptomyces calidiresistens TaxID=1485586 RepID=UPI002B1F729E|nr:site-specific integrase [Streptomyces calidiresistens]
MSERKSARGVYVYERKNTRGEVTSHQVKWRLAGEWQTEKFEGTDAQGAQLFADAVRENGGRWPAGWVRGEGFISVPPEMRFAAYALRRLELRTGIEERYRAAAIKELRRYILPTFGECDIRSSEHFNSDTIAAWVLKMQRTKVRRGREMRPMSPKTVRNLHGLLASILGDAVRAEPPLRERNPCALTRLPRADDHGIEEQDEDMTFCTPQEVEAIIGRLTRPADRHLAVVAYGTGLRWGEISALAVRHVLDLDGAKPRVQVARAWKRHPDATYYLGAPKSKASRRFVRISPSVVRAFRDAGVSPDRPASDLIFTNDHGERLPHSSFYERWRKAVKEAQEAGELASHKAPTPHDLRHSHAAALISAGHGLPYVQRRLGHESIDTTNRVYGHLLPEADDDAMATVESVLAGRRPVLRAVG